MRNIKEDGSGWPRNFYPPNTHKDAVVGYPYPDSRFAQPAFIAGVLLVVASAWMNLKWYFWLPTGFVILILACSVCKQLVVDVPAKRIDVYYRLFFRRTLKQESFPIGHFKNIIYIIDQRSDEWPVKRVGLLSETGQRYWIRAFNCDDGMGRASRGAESFAWRLSCDTGIPIEDKPVELQFWKN